MDWIKTDDLSVILGVGLASVFVLAKFLKPQSLVHPLLMGRQADVGRVRLPGESAVYRNYATGFMGRLPERPKPEIKLLGDLIQDVNVAPRQFWSKIITNAELKARVGAFGRGLTKVGLTPRESTAILLLDDSLEFLITDLALASQSIVSFTLSSFSLFAAALVKNAPLVENAPTAIIIPEKLLEQVLEHLVDSSLASHFFVIVLGGASGDQRSGIRILSWDDIEDQGNGMPATSSVDPPEPSDLFSIGLFADVDGELRGAQLTHANVTAGVTASRHLFPTTPITSTDTLLSAFSITSPYGRSLVYTALYEGANFASLPVPLESDGSGKYHPFSRKVVVLTLAGASKTTSTPGLLKACEASAASPTILFMTPEHLKSLTSSILKAASRKLLFGLAWRHKRYGLQAGFITKVSFWDNLIFDDARAKTLRKLEASLRGIVVSKGPLEVAAVEPARIAFSIPVVNAHTHPLVCGPVMASHPLDLQSFPVDAEPHITVAHVGPPAVNVEVKLVGVLETSVETGGDFAGDILVRGPTVTSPLPVLVSTDLEGWLPLKEKGRVQTNGTFKML